MRMPYVHIICSLLAKTIGSPVYCVQLENAMAGFLDYKPPRLNDRRRGARGLRAVYKLMTPAQRAKADQEDLHLREVEASATLAGMVGVIWILTVMMKTIWKLHHRVNNFEQLHMIMRRELLVSLHQRVYYL